MLKTFCNSTKKYAEIVGEIIVFLFSYLKRSLPSEKLTFRDWHLSSSDGKMLLYKTIYLGEFTLCRGMRRKQKVRVYFNIFSTTTLLNIKSGRPFELIESAHS